MIGRTFEIEVDERQPRVRLVVQGEMARNRIDSSGRKLVLCASDDSAGVRPIRLAGLSADFEVVPNLDGLAE